MRKALSQYHKSRVNIKGGGGSISDFSSFKRKTRTLLGNLPFETDVKTKGIIVHFKITKSNKEHINIILHTQNVKGSNRHSTMGYYANIIDSIPDEIFIFFCPKHNQSATDRIQHIIENSLHNNIGCINDDDIFTNYVRSWYEKNETTETKKRKRPEKQIINLTTNLY